MYGGAYNDGNPLSPGSKAANGDFVVSYQYGAQGVRTGDYLAEAFRAKCGCEYWGMAAENKTAGHPPGRCNGRAHRYSSGRWGLVGYYRMTLQRQRYARAVPQPGHNWELMRVQPMFPAMLCALPTMTTQRWLATRIGRAGIGDIDMDVRGQTLSVTNLYNKKLIAGMDVAGKTEISGTNPSDHERHSVQTPIPIPACPQYAPTVGVTTTVASGEGRPWDRSAQGFQLWQGLRLCRCRLRCLNFGWAPTSNRQKFCRYDVGASSWMTTPLVTFPLNYRTYKAGSGVYNRYFQPWLPMALDVPTTSSRFWPTSTSTTMAGWSYQSGRPFSAPTHALSRNQNPLSSQQKAIRCVSAR
jgi:hypothetical protein